MMKKLICLIVVGCMLAVAANVAPVSLSRDYAIDADTAYASMVRAASIWNETFANKDACVVSFATPAHDNVPELHWTLRCRAITTRGYQDATGTEDVNCSRIDIQVTDALGTGLPEKAALKYGVMGLAATFRDQLVPVMWHRIDRELLGK